MIDQLITTLAVTYNSEILIGSGILNFEFCCVSFSENQWVLGALVSFESGKKFFWICAHHICIFTQTQTHWLAIGSLPNRKH